MIKFGIVGTNWISGDFVDAIKKDNSCKIVAVCSRKKETGLDFCEKYELNIEVFTDLEEMTKSDIIDAVYIGSPNSLHGEQAFICLNNKKHVICEKPITTDLEIFDKNVKLAKKNNVAYMEAMKTTFLPNMKVLKENLSRIGTVRNVVFNYSQYSSRYDKLLEGEVTNVFNPKFHGGSSFDLGVYPVYMALDLFGEPLSYTARNYMLPSGVDGAGTIILTYEDKIVTIIHSKISQTYTKSEILGEKGSIIIEDISRLKSIKLVLRDGTMEYLTLPQSPNQMVYELKEFLRLIKDGEVESPINSFENSRNSVEILSRVRNKI